MRKLILLTIFIGWFWGLRISHPDGGAISVVVGPFATKASCEDDKELGVAFFERSFPISQVVNCQEKKEA